MTPEQRWRGNPNGPPRVEPRREAQPNHLLAETVTSPHFIDKAQEPSEPPQADPFTSQAEQRDRVDAT